MKLKSLIYFCLCASLSARAATFTVTPNLVSNNYLGLITFQMNGLSLGETVQVQEFYDANDDGTVDPGDYGVRFETVSDGGLKEIAGLPNPNSFHDVDGAANGAITALIPFPLAPDTTRGLGNYIFRMSSPSNHFAATNLRFTVTSPAYAQSVQGAVQNNSTNLPFALVALTQQTSGGDTVVIAGLRANAAGNYSIPAPPGVYTVLAFRTGFVASFANAPSLTLAPGATVTTNLNLIAATSLLGGSLVDSTNYAVPAVPDAELLAFSTNSLVTIGVADSNGNFSIPVTPNNVWVIRPNVESAIPEAYLPVEPGNEMPFQTFTGPVTNALILLKHATAVLYGQVQDNHGDPIPGVGLVANGDGGQYDGNAISDANGNYFLAIDGGIGFIEVENMYDAPASNLLWSGTQYFINDGQAVNTNVIGTLPTARFLSLVADETGAPVTNVTCFASCPAGTVIGNTGTNGELDMPVFAGTWNLYIGAANVIFPEIPPFTITNGVNFTYNIVVRTITGQISGQVRNASNVGISNIDVMIATSVGPTNFALGAFTDTNGNYSVAVFNGVWNVSPSASSLQSAGYEPVAALDVPVPPTNAIADFVPGAIPPTPPPEFLTTNLPGSVLGDFYFVELGVTNGEGYLTWSLESGALPGGLTLGYFGVEVITGTVSNSGLFNFTLEVTDSEGRTASEALSINVLAVAPGPLAITTTSLPDGAQGCPYTNQLQASGGTPPYSWALAPSSGPLPQGVTLGTNGLLSGEPATNNFYDIDAQVTDSAGQLISQAISFIISPPLQVYPGALSGGELGLAYSGGVYASGGEQTQTWSIISGSLPPKLTLDPPSGEISGMPTTPGTYNFKAQVTDGCATVDLDTSITIYSAPYLTTSLTLYATTGTNFSVQLDVSGGAPPFSFYTAGPLPDGLSLGPGGLISGMTYFDSTNSFEVEIYDSVGGAVTANLTIIVSLLPLLDDPAKAAPNQFSFRVTGVSGQSYTAQYSSNLTDWMELYTTNAPDTIFFIADTNAIGSRLYRLKVNN